MQHRNFFVDNDLTDRLDVNLFTQIYSIYCIAIIYFSIISGRTFVRSIFKQYFYRRTKRL